MIKTFPTKQFQGKYCLSPFVMIEVSINGDVRMCGCSGWMPATIGNLKKTTLKEMLHSDLAQKIRQSIIEGMYQAFYEKREVTTEDICLALKEFIPLANLESKQMSKLQNWATSGQIRLASSEPIYI